MPRRRTQGFALIAVIALLAITAVILISMTNESLLLASESRQAVLEAQHRWATRSCFEQLLPQSIRLFDDRWTRYLEALDQYDAQVGPEPQRPRASFIISIELAKTQYDLVLASENAKLNVNVLYDFFGRQRTQQFIDNALRTNDPNLNVTLRPDPRIDALYQAHSLRPYEHNVHKYTMAHSNNFSSLKDYDDKDTEQSDLSEQPMPQLKAIRYIGQLFPTAQPDQLVGKQDSYQGALSLFTLWGDRSIDFRLAEDNTLRAASQMIIGSEKADRLVIHRERHPTDTWPAVLANLELNSFEAQKLSSIFSEQSSCFSLWVISRTQLRSRYSLAIATITPQVAREDNNEIKAAKRYHVMPTHTCTW